MSDLKTVGNTSDPLSSMQIEGVSRMRASLLACSPENPITTKYAMNQVLVLRVYHQLTRIVRYIELMDKLEEKLYASLETTIDKVSEDSPSTWAMLLNIQERLQKNMIESHKLLQPYLELDDFSIADLLPADNNPSNSPVILDQSSRDKLRNSAQAVLLELNMGD